MALTRIRIEASAKTEVELEDDLIGAVSFVQETYGGEWEQEQTETQTTKDGWWGYYTMKVRRKDGAADSVHQR